jgi:hypothetical protein
MNSKQLLMTSVMCAAISCCCAEKKGGYLYSFAKGKWNQDQWSIVKSPRWEYVGEWVQQPDHIVNKVPLNATPNEMLSKKAGKTYTSMLLKKKFSGSIKISSTMSFDHRMAPLIVITPAFGKDAKGNLEHREHFEIVLFDKGLNVWHHYYKDGKPSWRKAAFLKAEFLPNKKYKLNVAIKFTTRGPMMTISCGGHTFGYTDDTLPKSYYVGLTGCEGVNRFYDFEVSQ